jgi:hypothetical protein
MGVSAPAISASSASLARGGNGGNALPARALFPRLTARSFTAKSTTSRRFLNAWRWSPTVIHSPAIHRIKGVKEETVTAWLTQAAWHSQALEAVLLGDHQLSRAQLDALWTFVGHKGEKGGSQRSRDTAPSGAARRSKARHGSESDAPSPRLKKKSREP